MNALTPSYQITQAGWRSGYAADCKSVYTGSIPVPASIYLLLSYNQGMFAIKPLQGNTRGVIHGTN